MIAYVIPVRPKGTSENWEETVFLLRRTIRSVLQSKDEGFRVYVASHDLEGLDGVESDKVCFLRVDQPMPEDWSTGQRDRRWKVVHAVTRAVEDGADWIFPLDADDVISNRLTGEILSAGDYDAVRLLHGYEIHAGWGRLFRRSIIDQLTSSSFAVRARHVFESPDRAFFSCIFHLWHHKNLPQYFADHGWKVAIPDLPLVGYVRFHGQNVSNEVIRVGFGDFLRQWVKFRLLGQRLGPAFKEEFGW